MIKILFICLGNICRSPMAEFVMKQLVAEAGLAEEFEIASAATSSFNNGCDMYPPASAELSARGVERTRHHARQMKKRDYDRFDLIIGMDRENLYDMERLWPEDEGRKLHLILDYTDNPRAVSDPYYTGDYARAYEDVREGCEALLRTLQKNNPQSISTI